MFLYLDLFLWPMRLGSVGAGYPERLQYVLECLLHTARQSQSWPQDSFFVFVTGETGSQWMFSYILVHFTQCVNMSLCNIKFCQGGKLRSYLQGLGFPTFMINVTWFRKSLELFLQISAAASRKIFQIRAVINDPFNDRHKIWVSVWWKKSSVQCAVKRDENSWVMLQEVIQLRREQTGYRLDV